MQLFGLRKWLLLPSATAALLGLCAWWPHGDSSPLCEVDTSPASRLRINSRHAVTTIQVDQYTLAAAPVLCSPVGAGGVVILDCGSAACVANLSDPGHARDLPELAIRPLRRIYVAPDQPDTDSAADAYFAADTTHIVWEPGPRRLHISSGFLRRVYRLGDDWTNRRSLEVPFHSCYIGEGDMHSNGFVGCAALVLYDGQTTVFAHCLGGNGGQDAITVPGSITVRNVLDRLRAEIAFPGRWRAYAATGTAADLVYLSDSLRQIGIPLVHAEMMGKAGHGVSFCTRTATLSVVPQTP